MSLRRVLSIFWARLKEFYRDRASLGWALAFPLVLVAAFSLMFRGDGQQPATLAVVSSDPNPSELASWTQAFRVSRHQTEETALDLLRHHKVDLVVSLDRGVYWVNPKSAKSKVALGLWRGLMEPVDRIGRFEQQQLLSPPLSYAEWAFPGILGMNVMFSALFGVGWVIVHYRKTRVLRRLRVTPLRASEFLAAQILARLVIVAANTGIVFTLGAWILDISVKGSWGHLGLAYFLGALSLVSIGVVVSARTSSEELASGVINLMTWPMMLLSEIWFSLEGLPKWVERVASIMPLTHLNRAVRAIVNDGAGWAEVQAHFVYMGLLAALFLAIGSAIFRWESDT